MMSGESRETVCEEAVLLGWPLPPALHGLEEAVECRGLPDLAVLQREGLDLHKVVLHVDDLVADQRLQEHTHLCVGGGSITHSYVTHTSV